MTRFTKNAKVLLHGYKWAYDNGGSLVPRLSPFPYCKRRRKSGVKATVMVLQKYSSSVNDVCHLSCLRLLRDGRKEHFAAPYNKQRKVSGPCTAIETAIF